MLFAKMYQQSNVRYYQKIFFHVLVPQGQSFVRQLMFHSLDGITVPNSLFEPMNIV